MAALEGRHQIETMNRNNYIRVRIVAALVVVGVMAGLANQAENQANANAGQRVAQVQTSIEAAEQQAWESEAIDERQYSGVLANRSLQLQEVAEELAAACPDTDGIGRTSTS
jgi:hypothetical protein